jgi:hypothetical protein
VCVGVWGGGRDRGHRVLKVTEHVSGYCYQVTHSLLQLILTHQIQLMFLIRVTLTLHKLSCTVYLNLLFLNLTQLSTSTDSTIHRFSFSHSNLISYIYSLFLKLALFRYLNAPLILSAIILLTQILLIGWRGKEL